MLGKCQRKRVTARLMGRGIEMVRVVFGKFNANHGVTDVETV